MLLFPAFGIIDLLAAHGQEIPEEFYQTAQLYDNNASNAELAASIDKFIYSPGDPAHIFGYVYDVSAGQRVYIQIFDGIGNLRSVINVATRDDGVFRVQNDMPEDVLAGDYTISIKYGSNGVAVLIPITINIETIQTFVTIPSQAHFIDAEITYNPQIVIVKAGFPIVWKNEDETVHTVISGTLGFNNKMFADGKFDSGTFAPGSTFELSLQEGEYDYFCKLHPWLRGTIVVNPTDEVMQYISSEIEESKQFTKLLNNAENVANWSYELCENCEASIDLSSDKKEGLTSIEWRVKGNVGSEGRNSSLYLDFTTIDITELDFLKLWIKTEGNVASNSKILILDTDDNLRLLKTFNSQSFSDWTDLTLSLNNFVSEIETFNPISVTALKFELPEGIQMEAKQQTIFLDDLRWVVMEETKSEISNLKDTFLTINLQKESFFMSEPVSLHGNFTLREGNLPVTIQIFNPKQNLISIDQIVPDEESNEFEFELQTVGELFAEEGDYRVVVQYGINENRAETSFLLVPPIFTEKNYKGFDIYLTDKYYAVPISFFEGAFKPERLKPGDYSVMWVHDSLDEVKDIINKNPLGPIWTQANYNGFNIFFFDGTYFAILTTESPFDVQRIVKGDYSEFFVGNSITEIRNNIDKPIPSAEPPIEKEVKVDAKENETKQEDIILPKETDEASNDIILLQLVIVVGVLSVTGFYAYKSIVLKKRI